MGIIENAKEIAGIIQKADNIDLYGKIIGLQADIMKMMEDINLLKEENKSLLKLQEISGKMELKIPFWYYDAEEIPSCPKCWESDKKLSHLVSIRGGSFHCPTCGLRYHVVNGEIANIYKK